MNRKIFPNIKISHAVRIGCCALLAAVWLDGHGKTICGLSGSSIALAAGIQPPANILGSIDTKAKNISQYVRSLQPSIRKVGDDFYRTQVTQLRAAVTDLQQDLNTFQANNRAANFPQGINTSNTLQQLLNSISASVNNFANARDLNSAQQTLSQVSTAINSILQDVETLPPCCTEGICCHVAFKTISW